MSEYSFTIKGARNEAVCYTKIIEPEAVGQIQRMCNYAVSDGSRIRIMPDVHAGKGCTIGTTMTIVDRICPNLVGVDIGCGMYTVNIGRDLVNYSAVDAAAHYVPSGNKVWDTEYESFDFSQLFCHKYLKNKEWLAKSLGTLGGGNHFIEIDRTCHGTYYIVIHSGSRNLGKQVAEFYQKLAVKDCSDKKEYVEARNREITRLKEAGRQREIPGALKAIKRKASSVPDDLAFLTGEHMKMYLHDIEICQEFAKRNRECIAMNICRIARLKPTCAFHTIHNYIDTKEMILRKGSIAAHKGEKVLIPINMRDGSIIAIGKGNPDWNYSAPHGAGRLLSRSKAKEILSLDDFEAEMNGIYTTSVRQETIDESPMAYKSLSDIIDVISESVDVIDVMKPVYNFKA